MIDKLKICLKPLDCKKWSDEFKISALKEKLKCNQNIMWNHHRTYSILRKEATGHKEVFNYYLLPALIIRNCLPMPILMTLSHVMKTEEERKANNRTELLQSSRATEVSEQSNQNKELLGDFAFQRGEEKVFDMMNSPASRAEILLHLNDQNFVPRGILLQQANEAINDEKAIVFRDSRGRAFQVYARVDTSKAGTKVVIYAKNVLLCHTEQSIEFFYQKKVDLF